MRSRAPALPVVLKTFGALDLAVLVLYLLGTTWLGLHLGRSQKNSRDYFVGDHRLPWWSILFSVVATETSALTFISVPGLAYAGNLSFLQICLGYVLGRIVVAYTLLPLYFRGHLVTAYALLEKRFGVATRRFASITFMVTRAFGDSVRVFATAIPILLVLKPLFGGAENPWILPVSIIVLGIFTTIYTYHGGIRAVVWTDFVQTLVYLLGGISAVVLLHLSADHGWVGILERGAAAGKLRVLDFTWGLDHPFSFFAGVIGGAFLSMASHGADQLIVQRLLAAHGLRDAQRALIWSGFFVLAQMTLFLLIGVGLFDFYHASGATFASPDHVFPTFIVQVMPSGLTGLFVAAILAATMSAHSGAVNSMAAASTHDLYLPLTGRKAEDPSVLRVAKRLTLFWAAVLVAGALAYRDSHTPVVTLALSVASFTYGGLLGGFFLGILDRRSTQRDALIGMACGILTMITVFAIPSVSARIAWPWYVLIGTATTLAVGCLSARVLCVRTER